MHKVGETPRSFVVTPEMLSSLQPASGGIVAKAKADEFYSLDDGYRFTGVRVDVLGVHDDRIEVRFGNGRRQWLDSHCVRVKAVRLNGKWLRRGGLRDWIRSKQ